jgi:hypothetical protein
MRERVFPSVGIDGTDIVKQLQDARSSRYYEQRRQTEEKNREDELDADFPGALFRLLAAPDTQVVRLRPEGLRDACAETIGLDEHGHQLLDLVFADAPSKAS